MRGTGYGDSDFLHNCFQCHGDIDHNLLGVAKLRKDIEDLTIKDWPLVGTIISPFTGDVYAPTSTDYHTGKNASLKGLISIELCSHILEFIESRLASNSMIEVKEIIEYASKGPNVMKQIHSKLPRNNRPSRRERLLLISRTMSRYDENASIFALELSGAVIRQSAFVEKMYHMDWLHSLTASDAMARLLLRYLRFMNIIFTNALHVAVPTLDVDLAWHTHQLSSKQYFLYNMTNCGRFVDHDDKIDNDKLSTSFKWTSEMYETMYEEVYLDCTYWGCEGFYISCLPLTLCER